MASRLTKRELKALTSALDQLGVAWEAIYLFGSTAKGFATKDSDRDFCVIVPDDTQNIDAHWNKLSSSLGLKGFNFDILLTTESEFLTNKVSPILHEIRNTGIKVA